MLPSGAFVVVFIVDQGKPDIDGSKAAIEIAKSQHEKRVKTKVFRVRRR